MVAAPRDTAQVLVTVKAYPTRAEGHGEAVCVAGVRLDEDAPRWVRVWPVPFRRLDRAQQFRKYDVVTVDLVEGSDARPESRRPRADTLRVERHIGTERQWDERRKLVEPLLVSGMCEVQRRQQQDGTSLAAFRPAEILGWEVQPAGHVDVGQQLDMFEPSAEALEDIPWKFRYRYRCAEPRCPTHKQRLLDWELGQAFRSWRLTYGEEGALEQIAQKWMRQIVGPDRDVVFFVGSIARYPQSFCVLGVFWPPSTYQLSLGV